MAVLLQTLRILAPVVALLGLGYLLGSGRLARAGRRPDLGAASWLALYVFAPCQVFSGLYGATFRVAEAARVFAAMCFVLAALAALASLLLRVRKDWALEPFLLTVLFANTGYYGLPVCFLAFGKPGFSLAVLYMVCASVLTNTFGLYLAARGSASGAGALGATLRSPILWSLALSLAARAADLHQPAWAFALIDLIANAAIPLVLVLLGAQLAQLEVEQDLPAIGASAGLRLIVSPLLATAVATAFGFAGVVRQVFIVQSAMPTAVIVGLFALSFDARPRFVSGAVLGSTLLSPLTLLAVLAAVR